MFFLHVTFYILNYIIIDSNSLPVRNFERNKSTIVLFKEKLLLSSYVDSELLKVSRAP